MSDMHTSKRIEEIRYTGEHDSKQAGGQMFIQAGVGYRESLETRSQRCKQVDTKAGCRGKGRQVGIRGGCGGTSKGKGENAREHEDGQKQGMQASKQGANTIMKKERQDCTEEIAHVGDYGMRDGG